MQEEITLYFPLGVYKWSETSLGYSI